MTPHDISLLLLSLGILLAVARLLGEVAQRLSQPAVLGELLAGVILGPTVLGHLWPDAAATLFPAEGVRADVLNGFSMLAIVLFLLVAGMEVDLSTVWRRGKIVSLVALTGMAAPFAVSLLAALAMPTTLGMESGEHPTLFAFFFATAMSISALPVIAKILMDLRLYRTDLGMIVIAVAILNDLIGWLLFAAILGAAGESAALHFGAVTTLFVTFAYAAFMLTVVRIAIHRSLPWVLAHTSWPGGILGFSLALALLSAAFTEAIGVHAIFGSFLLGVAIGDSPHLREHTRMIIGQFVSFIFAPLFFATIGLKVDFVSNLDPMLVLLVLVLACLGKIIGGGIGARWGGMRRREAWAIGFALNARGAMEIVLGLLALQHGLIGERLFVALVVMALVTSVLSGPAMQRLLRHKRPSRLADHLSPRAFASPLHASSRRGAVRELTELLAPVAGIDRLSLDAAIWEREQDEPTGLGGGVAVPHARVPGLTQPIVAMGLSPQGVDFDAPDGHAAHAVFLLAVPENDNGAHLDIMADIARAFGDPAFLEQTMGVASFVEFLALLKTRTGE